MDLFASGNGFFPTNAVVICGVKDSGKTTLIETLVTCLTADGFRVAVIKHDAHDFSCDVPGTDSDRFARAGACGVAAYSAKRFFVHKPGGAEDARSLARFFPDADIILIEGCKDSACRKIEVIRKAVSKEPVSNPEGRFLIVTDHPDGTFAEETARFTDTAKIAAMIRARTGHGMTENTVYETAGN